MSNFFLTLIWIVCCIMILLVFIQSMRDLLMSEDTKKWFYSTRIGAWVCNRRNKVKILTDEEYYQMWNGKTVEGE